MAATVTYVDCLFIIIMKEEECGQRSLQRLQIFFANCSHKSHSLSTHVKLNMQIAVADIFALNTGH